MRNRLSLYVPKLDDLWYRERLMSDPATMRYNRGYELDFTGYHRDTGCIDFPQSEWKEWYDYFIVREPLRYYAYLARMADGAWIGEVNFHKNPEQDWHEMGVVIEAKHRGRGYAVEALRLLEEQAFERSGIEMLHNDFEVDREAAFRIHLAAGFTESRRENGLIELTLTREQYFGQKQTGMDT